MLSTLCWLTFGSSFLHITSDTDSDEKIYTHTHQIYKLTGINRENVHDLFQ